MIELGLRVIGLGLGLRLGVIGLGLSLGLTCVRANEEDLSLAPLLKLQICRHKIGLMLRFETGVRNRNRS